MQIAKIRSLGLSTILGHLIDWYAFGGNFAMYDFITPAEEKSIRLAIAKVGSSQKLSPIKKELPEEISYEKIRMVIAKMQRK